MRGSAQASMGLWWRNRFIPARAGIGRSAMRQSVSSAVHPRPCGDRQIKSALTNTGAGSSPPVRGSADINSQRSYLRRFIPARAGIGDAFNVLCKKLAVHPRPCGGRARITNETSRVPGSSPPVRGSDGGAKRHLVAQRFIPARAGIGAIMRTSTPIRTVHPRPCGDRLLTDETGRPMSGSSPPVRGSANSKKNKAISIRFIPARAGIGSSDRPSACQTPVHPRPCGDRVAACEMVVRYSGSSPPVRGSDGH